MLHSAKFRAVCAVVLAALAIFSFTPPGEWCVEQLAQKIGLTDFQSVCRSYPFSLHVIDVGRADALCVIAGEAALLIDGGTADRGNDVADYLVRLGVTELTAAINTHPDDDHIGGMAAVLRRFPCRAFYASPAFAAADEPDAAAVRAVLEEKRIPVYSVSRGERLTWGELQAEVLSPAVLGDDSNENSLVLRLLFQNHTFLLMGDAGKAVEEQLLASGEEISADVLKVGHHGSNTATTAEFLQAVSPRFAVISTGRDNNHLPRIPVLRRLERCEALYRTDTDGSVIFCSDGDALAVYTEK